MKADYLGKEEGQQLIEIWSKSVDTQMHFNEMQVKSRQLGLTFVTAALGIGIVLLSEGNAFSFSIDIFGHKINIHVSVLLTSGAMLALQAVKLLDLNVYHRMLRGAVTFGEDFENNCLIPMLGIDKGMTSSISHFSRFDDASITKEDGGKYSYQGIKRVTAHDKIRTFYRATQAFLLFAAFLLLIFTNSSSFGNETETKGDAAKSEQNASGQAERVGSSATGSARPTGDSDIENAQNSPADNSSNKGR